MSSPDPDQTPEPDFAAARPGDFVGWPQLIYRTQPETVFLKVWPDDDLVRHRVGTGLALEAMGDEGWWTFMPSLTELERLSIAAAPPELHEFPLPS